MVGLTAHRHDQPHDHNEEDAMGWWKAANEAEDPDKFAEDLRNIGKGIKTLGKAVRDEIKESRTRDRGDDKRR